MLRKTYKKFISRLPYVRELKSRLEAINSTMAFPPGHYYSPIFCEDKSEKKEQFVDAELQEIDLNINYQDQLLKEFDRLVSDFDFPLNAENQNRYFTNNNFYKGLDALTLFCFLRKFEPNRVIEIGSGYSSALMLDTRDKWGLKTRFKFIEPYPDRLLQLVNENENIHLIRDKIQDVDLEIFDELSENDFLIIDTSHISKTNSDVNHILFNILPKLRKNVFIHFHDIFYPFEYPDQWVYQEKRSWNEIYILRAFLMYNSSFEIVFFNDFLIKNASRKKLSFFSKAQFGEDDIVGSVWLKKSS